MQANRTFVESFTKTSTDSPWVISIVSPLTSKLVRVSVGENGEVEVGPRLSGVLSIMERHIVAYPFQFSYHKLEQNNENDYFIRMLNNYFVYIEAGIGAYRTLTGKDFLQYGRISYTNNYKELLPRNTYTPTQMSASYVPQDSNPSGSTVKKDSTNDTSYFIVASAFRILDGDTIELTIDGLGEKLVGKLTDKQNNVLGKGDKVTLRYIGLNTPETKAHFDANPQEGNERNAEYCDTYKVTLDQAYEIGQEAMDFVTSNTNGKKIVADLDCDAKGNPSMDTPTYHRYMGVIYTVDSSISTDSILKDGIAYGVNLNKSLLATDSTKYMPAPLAEPYEHYVDDTGYSRFDVIEWLFELGIRDMNNVDTSKPISDNLDLDKALGIDTTEPDNVNDTDTLVFRYQESPDNRLQFVKPLDDRQEELWGENGVDDRVRIGDVCLVIPPLSIQVNRVSTVNREKVLRSKTSIMTKTIGSNQTITLQLYFHDIDSINGHYDDKHPSGTAYYMDGLRPLIAQFKKAPFLPIDNEYINDVLNIQDVALVSLNITTVPNFPQSISATLTLAKFDNQAYMPGTASLGDAINYPLLRWYYQESMKEHTIDGAPNPYRTYLKPLTGPLTNDFKFSLASEPQLIERQAAIKNLRSLDTPQMIQAKIDDATTEIGKQIKDGETAQALMKIWNTYVSLKADGMIPAEDAGPGVFLSYSNASDPKYKEAWIKLFGSKVTTGPQLSVTQNWFIPHKCEGFADSFATFSYAFQQKYKDDMTKDGVFHIRLFSMANVQIFSEEEQKAATQKPENISSDQQNMPTGQYVVFPGTDVQKLQRIIDRGYEAVASANDQIESYNKTQALVQQTEGALDLVEYPINGLIPISLNVVYENTFIPVQMESNDCATLQYLGSQDPYVQLSFHADNEGVAGIRALLNEVERYSSQYRIGITSGFVGAENQLLGLFGVTTIMPESVTFATVEGMPGTTEIQMSVYAFDKTQKRMETLEGMSPIYGSDTKESRHVTVYDSAKDNAVIENKMKQMEVYPDLELPKYEELAAVLPKLGANIDYYENRANSVYLDPDFYISTEWTFREYIRDLSKKEQRLDFVDFAGISMYTSTLESDPMVPTDAASMQTVYQLDNETPDVSGAFSDGSVTITNGVMNTENPDGSMPVVAPADTKAIQDWLKVSSNVSTIPSMADWGDWIGWTSTNAASAQAEYASWMKNLQPSEEQVYVEIYSLIDEVFMGGDGFIYNDKKDTSDAWRKATYGSVNNIWYANYRVMAATDPKMPKLPDDEEKIKTSDYKKFAMITRERLANYLKAIFDTQSSWKQMRADNSPKTNFNESKGTYHAGIGNIDIAAFAKNVSEAKRLLWDWKYNLRTTMEYLFRIYLGAAASSDNNYKSHPWDWMVYGFGEGKFDQTKQSAYYQAVILKFQDAYNSRNHIYATPSYTINPKIMMIRDGLTEYQYEVIMGEKDALLSELKKAGMSKDELDKLKKKSSGEVRDAYVQYMKDAYDPQQDASAPVGKAMEDYSAGKQAAAEGRRNASSGDKEVYGNFTLYQKLHNMVDEEENRLVNDVDPQTIFKEMFTDMIDYDMRGRMARAFPAFQIFIIDEGRWMGNYRLWDNLYGYNAIQSIDVHRSRKIAADTAILKMTNIYSNLTSRPMSDTNTMTENYSFWDNLVFNNPSDKLIESRKQLLQAMLLETGARVHIRIGYGADVEFLPVVFNGTVTEIDTSEIVQIVAQGDGLELCNVISADPGDSGENKYWWGKTKEPRDFLCELMTTKGNWVKNAVAWATSGRLFKDNPSGIQHFGNPMDAIWANVSWEVRNKDYGEVCQNIYSANGQNTFSDYVYNRTGKTDYKTESMSKPLPFKWKGYIPDWTGGDEPDIKMKLYGKTVWDVAQIFAMCVPDYITAVHPFETRSTLFYGKPWWRLAYKYSSQYQYNADTKEWERTILEQHRKPYMQFHIMDSHMDIINNQIQANADFANVILAQYNGGKVTQPIYADYDIYFSQQRTKQVNVDIVSDVGKKLGELWEFWTVEKQALYAGMSILRDECKDMYQGSLTILGSPTIKPYDMVYMNDTLHEMSGNILVKSVTHHFSYDTGFVTSIEPDALVVNDDKALMSMANWAGSAGISAGSAVLGLATSMYAKRKVASSSLARKAIDYGKKGATKATEASLKKMIGRLPDTDEDIKLFKSTFKDYLEASAEDKPQALKYLQEAQGKLDGKIAQWETEGMFEAGGKNITGVGSKLYMKGLLSSTENMVTALTDGARAFKLLRAAEVLTKLTPLTLIADLVIQWGVETLLEQWRRNKATYQAVLMMPLKYQGHEYTAGIGGHMGMVYGDKKQGKMDNFLSGLGFEDDNIFDTMFKWYGETMNYLSGDNRQYTYNKPGDLSDISNNP